MLRHYFEERLRLDPALASFLGDRTRDAEYGNPLDAVQRERSRRLLLKYRTLGRAVEEEGGGAEERLDGLLLRTIVRDGLEALALPFDLMPITSFDNPVTAFAFEARTIYPLDGPGDVASLLSRSHSFRDFLRDAVARMRLGQRRGVTLPRIVARAVVRDLRACLAGRTYAVALPPRLATAEEGAAYEAFAHGPLRAEIARLLDFLVREYTPGCRRGPAVGLCGMAAGGLGARMYAHCVRRETSLPVTPEGLHALGRREVARIGRELMALRAPLDCPTTGSLRAFCTEMQRRHAFESAADAMRAFRQELRRVRRVTVPRLFGVSVAPCELLETPDDVADSSAAAMYVPAGGGGVVGGRPGRFFVNTRQAAGAFEVTALTTHEAEPGHHYQFQRMAEAGVPPERMHAYLGNAFVEGWALYAESLGDYDALQTFGRLTYEMLRAVRLVVDTGLHRYGWSFARACAYMRAHLALPPDTVRSEALRYLCIPGQALAYKTGELFLLDLRAAFLARHGGRLDPDAALRLFHDRVLAHGVLPLDAFLDERASPLGHPELVAELRRRWAPSPSLARGRRI